MPVHAHQIVGLVEMVLEGALECPVDRRADPARQLDIGRGDHHAVFALLDANDPVGRTLTLLGQPLLVGDADDLSAVRPNETTREHDHACWVVVVAAVAGLAHRLPGIDGARTPLPSTRAVNRATLWTDGRRRELAELLIRIDTAPILSVAPAPPLRRQQQWRSASRHEHSLFAIGTGERTAHSSRPFAQFALRRRARLQVGTE